MRGMKHISLLFSVKQSIITLKFKLIQGREFAIRSDLFKNEGKMCTNGRGQSQIVKGSHCQDT